ncbi:MAG: molybdopterin-dependent oxidoreductase [Coriobacteriales bacterium]
MKLNKKITRRQFVALGAAGTAALAATSLLGTSPVGIPAAKALQESTPPEGKWVRTTCAPNCTGSCGMKAFVQDGQIKMISQAADYPYDAYNPRRCLKGLSINTLIHGPERMKAPMVRNEKTGELEETDWDTALSTAAEKLNAIAEKYGPDSIGVIWQVQGTGHIQKGALVRLTNMMGWSAIGGYELNGDLPMFWPETFGCQSEELESYCWEDSKYTMIFGSNPMVTRLPDSKFLNRSREAGGKVVCFDPNYSATAEKSTEWVQLKPDTDAAFALGICQHIVNKKLYDENFIKNFTDLPILINTETGKRILADEVEGLSSPAGIPDYRESYVAIDISSGSLVATDPTKIGNTSNYSLEGNVDVPLKSGGSVKARTGFELLCDLLGDYTPDSVSSICDVPTTTVMRIAEECSSIKPMHIIFGGSAMQWHHGDLKGRACALIAALTGNIGTLGGGISTYVGQYKTRFSTASWFVPPRAKRASAPFHYAVNGRTKTMSATFPKAGLKALVVGWGNPFEQHNVANWLREAKESGELECVICFEFQHTKTVDYSDVTFAAASWYEKTELVITPLHPWVQLMQPMVDPPGIAQPEIWICKELAHYLDPSLDDMWPDFDQEGAEKAAEDVLAMLLKNGGPTINHLTVEDLRKGPGKLAHTNPGEKHIPFYEQIHDGEPFPTISRPNDLEKTAKFVKTGRIEFYKDEDMFLKMGEQLPIYKPAFEETEWAKDPSSKEKYPFSYLTRNSVYRVHATYGNNPLMLELQDNTPKVFMNPDDAAAKGLEEGDVVEVFNGRGKTNGALICDPGMYPGQVIFDQGWWSRYTRDESFNSLIWPWINPIHEIYYVSSVWSPNMAWNECICDVRLLEKGAAKDKVNS